MNGHRSLSPYNDKHTRIGGDLELLINDCTLREGEQSPLINFRPEQKVSIAKRLADAGIRKIQVGYPGLSVSDFGVVRELKQSGLEAKIDALVLGYMPSWREQVQAVARCGADMAHLVYVVSKPRREQIFRQTREEVKERIRALIGAAKEENLHVTFSPADTTRTELDFVLEVAELAEGAGADVFQVSDTLGASTPGAVRYLVEQVRSAIRLPIAYHGHHDFGLAVANALSALEAGASILDTTLNGWGDRTGNPPTEEIVALLRLLYDVPLPIEPIAIANLSRAVAGELGVPIPPTKPITGALAAAHKLETHVKAVLRHPPAFEPFDPALVGGRRQVALGQYSGPDAIASRLADLDIALNEPALAALVARVQEAARATNRVLSDEDLRALVAQGQPGR